MKTDMKKVIAAVGIAALAAALFLMFGAGHRYKSLTVDAAVRVMESTSGYLIVDVRRADEYADGHIPGAVNVPLDDILEGQVDLLPDKEQTLLVYCYAGRRSKTAAEKLAELGYKNAYEFGGIVDWPGEVVKD